MKRIIILIFALSLVVAGIIYWMYQSDDRTKVWNVYQNVEYGFEMKYPNEVSISYIKRENKIIFSHENDAGIPLFRIAILSSGNNNTIPKTSSDIQKFKISNIECTKHTEDFTDKTAVFERITYILCDRESDKFSVYYYKPVYQGGKPVDQKELDIIFEKMISTIKFTK
ncbi:hypothetical protein KKA15_05960 [Patescibacteria group bacterium]|nr:hypothetical protein [Patescibacteria group bacterium]